MDQDHAFLDYVIKALVDHPEAVVTTRSVDEMGVLLRTLLRVVGMKHNARVNLKINEPVGGKREREDKTLDQVVDELGS